MAYEAWRAHGIAADGSRRMAPGKTKPYRKRKATVEPVFGQIKFNRGFDRFGRRGRSACRSEWRLFGASHNLLKLHNHRTAAAAA